MERDLAPDWILKQTLAIQEKAHRDWLNTKPELRPDDGGVALTVLGCGTIGIAILAGIMDSLSNDQSKQLPGDNLFPNISTPAEYPPQRLPTKFSACVRSHESALKIKSSLSKFDSKLTVHENNNVGPVRAADIILLSCRSQVAGEVLRAKGIKEALEGKLLISICEGITEAMLHDMIYNPAGFSSDDEIKCKIVRVVPNVAVAVRESMTVIAHPNPPLPEDMDRMITWIFTRVGRVVRLPSSAMDAGAALCGSGPAFVSLMVESLAAGAMAMGVPREESYTIAAQTMRGTTSMLLQGQHPAMLRDQVSTPGGSALSGLAVLEEGIVRGTIAKAVREATAVAGQLGRGST